MENFPSNVLVIAASRAEISYQRSDVPQNNNISSLFVKKWTIWNNCFLLKVQCLELYKCNDRIWKCKYSFCFFLLFVFYLWGAKGAFHTINTLKRKEKRWEIHQITVQLSGCCLDSHFYDDDVWIGKYAKHNDWSSIFAIFS